MLDAWFCWFVFEMDPFYILTCTHYVASSRVIQVAPRSRPSASVHIHSGSMPSQTIATGKPDPPGAEGSSNTTPATETITPTRANLQFSVRDLDAEHSLASDPKPHAPPPPTPNVPSQSEPESTTTSPTLRITGLSDSTLCDNCKACGWVVDPWANVVSPSVRRKTTAAQRPSSPSRQNNNTVPEMIASMFPFHFVLDQSLNMIGCGATLRKLIHMEMHALGTTRLERLFEIVSPRIFWTYESLLR
jgi:hypothetical protein